jgi:hypothetical protein
MYTNSNMSQRVKEFVRQSGVEVQTPDSNSNDEFAKELEQNMLRRQRERAAGFRTPPRPMPRQVQVPQRLQRNLVNDRSYAGAFKQFENNSPLENEFNDVKLSTNEEKMIDNLVQEFDSPLQFSKFNPGMFNATVDSGFGQKDVVVDLKNILTKRPLPKSPIGEGLYLDTKEIKGVYGQFKTGFSHTREAGPRGSLNKNFFSVQIMLTLSDDIESKGATVNIYRNGKIRFSGGFVGTNIAKQPELIRRFIVNNYTERQPFFYNPFMYNNLSGQFRINGVFKSLPTIASRQGMYGMTNMSILEEQTPFLYVPIENMTLIFSKTGNIQIVGAKTPGAMLKGYDIAKELVEKLYKDGQVFVTGVFDEGVKPKKKRKVTTPPKRKSNENARMSKAELIALARRKGVVNFRVKTSDGSRAATKDEIRTKIKNLSNKKNVSFKNKNKNVKLSGNGNTFRVGRKICTDLKKDELLRIAAILKIKPGEKDTKLDLCKKIQSVRNNLAKPKPKPPPPPPKPTKRNVVAAKRNVKKAEVIKKRGLDENSIRRDLKKLYGVTWMKRYQPNLNQDVRNLKSALNAINKGNKSGVPFKKDIDQVKKNVVSRWKMERRRELERKYLINKVNTTGIALNLKNAYKRAAANYIMSKKTPPSNKKMTEYRNYWLKFRANMNTNGNSRRVNRTARARVEKV